MLRYVGDLEANGLEDATVIHCAVFKNLETNQVVTFTPETIHELPEFLDTVDELIGHNFIGYDIPLIKRILGYEFQGKIHDTLVISRLLNPNRRTPRNCPNPGASPHGLESWGYRVGRGKPEHDDWETFSPEMLHRCTEDVEINYLTHFALEAEAEVHNWSRAIPMTNKLFEVFKKIEDYGWYVDQEWMDYCIKRLNGIINRIDVFLQDKLPYVYDIQETKTAGSYGYVKKPFKKNGKYSKNMLKWFYKQSSGALAAHKLVKDRLVGGPFCRIQHRRLTLDKRNEVVKMLLDAGWIPDKWNYNDDGEQTSPKLSKDDSFTGIEGAFGRHIVRRVQARHRRSNIQGFYKLIRPDGRISSRISGLAETSRVKHAGIVNIPNEDSFFGKHIRKIFVADKNKILVGVDSSGNQVRQLCALMGDEEYEYSVLHGKQKEGTDIHTMNQKAAGLVLRSQAKTFFYGFLFGAGDAKVGSIVKGTAADGKRLKAAFLDGLPKLKELMDRLVVEWRENASKRYNKKWNRMEFYNGWVRGLDGRPLFIKSEHAILVYVLQNMEAIQMSYALLFAYKWLNEAGLKWGDDYGFVCFYHDEINTECKPEHKELVGETVKRAIIHAGEYLKIKTPHDGDIKYGVNWYEIH